ncbi:MAG: hypothetical protein CGU28_14245 [Candidatus Dactylopiibacterium carminicum]|uniref:PD-(D/E)XK nuclease family protein n=1 Tax=Candidatus Dactylopiibacterium carminicum TaxID=857335 RepID=A0A272ENR2_9RHOO|nr:PD-(D/E)XK nuclease family protein [Candidatus Dactylopiibacterium carminicum]KAF7598142.1 PD-(D/E)XK nuclease family protein [Candidatus Dactylopiibacterium carminicum]PAS91752.1 MAG: hypothetical protein CGU29_14630 [Candidatus Dactylopiibacterium carminicum]PAS94124.1 MAG: hypothetical protein CGU28_14245 [Candidatus Dactylopiibacterium carminicum]PAS96732.1 MAG: hypothetical protein BSR46_15005 [Candidatus Dactylopiibacterium carminicum]
MTTTLVPLAPDAGFLTAAAGRILRFAAAEENPADLSAASLILPNLKLAEPLNAALAAAAGGPLLLPRTDTLNGMVEPWLAAQQVMPDARRQLMLHNLLRGREWLDEGMLWDVVAELTQLFDTLTEHELPLPADEASLLSRLEAAFDLHNSRALNFEARLVSALWHAEAQGRPSRAAARLLATSQWLASLRGPLMVMLESTEPGPWQKLIDAAAERVPVLVLQPQRALATGPLADLLTAAWPCGDEAPVLAERVATLSPDVAHEASTQLQLCSAESLETLGQAVADQVLDWLAEGRRNIALVACDRLAARRARALLEREGVLLQDETGWKMVTTRVAAVVDAWLEVLASDAWHRALIDLLRAPLLFHDLEPLARARAAEAVAGLIDDSRIASGMNRLRAAAEGDASAILDRLLAARAEINPGQACSLAEWLRRLLRSLELLGALPHFERDMAGREWLGWLETRQTELADDDSRFRFGAWRTWFNRQMEAELFRDERVDSPVIITHLAASRLRSFEAVIVIGADGEHLAPPRAPGWLTHAGVRRELGLPGLETEQRQLREDLAGVLLAADRSMIVWQSLRRDEAMMPAPDVAVLEAALAMTLGLGVVRQAHAHAIAPAAELAPQGLPAPGISPARVPQRLSASALQSLMDCPYRYFARHVLRLGEREELAEGIEKRDFGEFLHLILHRFHTAFPVLAGQDEAGLLVALEQFSDDAFAQAVAHNFHDHAWRLRWRARLHDYLAWQLAREAEGFRWQAGELQQQREHELGQRRTLLLNGRIDRVDKAEDGTDALIDYKSRRLEALNKQAADADDVQLAFYALLRGTHVGQAGYLALDGDKLGLAALSDPEARAAALQECITASFNALYEGAPLPAQGTPSACAYCEMHGLCRKAWAEAPRTS